MKTTTAIILAMMIGSPALAQITPLAGATPGTTCECYDGGFLFGSYNYTPQNSAQSETLQFKCGLQGWEQAFNDGLYEGYKDYLVSKGDYSLGMGDGFCPYSNY